MFIYMFICLSICLCKYVYVCVYIYIYICFLFYIGLNFKINVKCIFYLFLVKKKNHPKFIAQQTDSISRLKTTGVSP